MSDDNRDWKAEYAKLWPQWVEARQRYHAAEEKVAQLERQLTGPDGRRAPDWQPEEK